MKKKLSLVIAIGLGIFGFSQVGIGTDTPQGALDVEAVGWGGLVLPMASSSSEVMNPTTGSATTVAGTIYFDTTDKCVKFYNGSEWECLALDQ